MKKYLLSVFVFFLLFGCGEEFLDQENPNTVTPDTFWKTETDAVSAIVGTYSPLSTIFYHGRIWAGFEMCHSDELQVQGSFYGTTHLFGSSAANGNYANAFAEMWKVIFRANLVLQNVPNIDMDKDLQSNILGEAYFLRAYNYFTLVSYFEYIPLVTEPAGSLEETQQPQVPSAQVWTQIKADLTAAIPLLPDSWDNENKGRVTAGAAAALLGKSHLHQQEWGEAATQLKRVIDGEFGTYDLMPNYSDNFREGSENNAESLFEIQYDVTGAWTAGWGSDVPSTARYSSFDQDFAIGSVSNVNDWVFDLFMLDKTNSGDIDPRAYETMVWDYDGATHFGEAFSTKFATEIANHAADPIVNKMSIKAAKYINPTGDPTRPSFNSDGNNKRIIRLADVLLMHAEAVNEASSPTDDAYASINRVRARADMPPIVAGLSQEEFRQKVRDERVLELCNEFHRSLDLKRWGMIPDRILDNPRFRQNGAQFQYQTGREHLPIPELEVNTNPFIEQSPGYF